MILAESCLCGKHLLERENEGICVWCGHGDAHPGPEFAYVRSMVNDTSPMPPTTTVPTLPVTRGGWDEAECIAAAAAWKRAHGRLPSSYDWHQPRHGERRPAYRTVVRIFGGWPQFRAAIAEVPAEQRLAA